MRGQDGQDLIDELQVMDRPALVACLRRLHCHFDLDFTDEFLDTISLERLRHIVLGASAHAAASADSIQTSRSA